jgi:hypothetical protein
MPNLTNSLLKIGVAASLSGAIALATGTAMQAEAQAGRIEARTERGIAVGVAGPNGGRAARARGCTGVEGGQACASGANVMGQEGARAGRASASQLGDDGSFSRDAGAYVLNENGEATRTLNTVVNPDGSGQRSVDGLATFENAMAERNSLVTVDENGRVIRTGTASGEGQYGVFATDGAGTYSQEEGLDFARENQAALDGENGAFAADGGISYNQEDGLDFQSVSGGSFENENGSVESQRDASYSQEQGFVVDRGLTAANAEGEAFESELSYNDEDGFARNTTCTNADGDTVACVN